MHTHDWTLGGMTLLPDGGIREATLTIGHGQITRVRAGTAGADRLVEGIIAPGFIDLQVNGAYGCDFTQDAASLRAVAARLPETGVTAFLPTIITSAFERYPDRLQTAAQQMSDQAADPRGAAEARILGVHLEGPYLNPKRKGAHPPAQIRPIAVDEIRAWADPRVTRLVTLPPELPGALEAVSALRQAGVVVSAGHSDATYAEALAGFAAGITWGTHLFNAMSGLGHREPGLAGALLFSRVPCGLIVDGIHVHPEMVRLAYQSKGAAGICLVTDSMAAMGMPTGGYDLGERAVTVANGSARLADGTLAGSILRMDQAVRNVIAFTGCALAEAGRMASTTPADVLGLQALGRIAPGANADLVILSADGQVIQTIIAGRVAFG